MIHKEAWYREIEAVMVSLGARPSRQSTIMDSDLRNVLELLGWEYSRHKGSHMIMTHPEIQWAISIPKDKPVTKNVLLQSLKKAGLTKKDLENFMNKKWLKSNKKNLDKIRRKAIENSKKFWKPEF